MPNRKKFDNRLAPLISQDHSGFLYFNSSIYEIFHKVNWFETAGSRQ